MNTLFVFGHKSPDTDSICSSIVMAELQNKLGNPAKHYRLGDINKETKFALDYFKIAEPELLSSVSEGDNIVLVDHNEFVQSVDGIEKASIQMVVDHHRINNFCTSEPLTYIAKPVGCTSTILYQLYNENNIEIAPEIAGLMLSAIISDTLLFKSPTCTQLDKSTAEELAKIANVDINTYGLDLLKAGTDLSEFTALELINLDSKEFSINDSKMQISQVNTVSIEDVLKNKDSLEKEMNTIISEKSLDLIMFIITDILECNSKAIVLGKKANLVEKSYGITLENNIAYLEGVVSRKKQVVPVLTKNA